MSALEIVLYVVGTFVVVMGINLAIWLPIAGRMKRLPDELRREVEGAGEVVVCGPERAIYRGATKTYGSVKGIGLVVLTDKRLAFRKAIGKPVDVPRAEIVSVRTEKWFMGSRAAGLVHVVVRLASGADVGFGFRDHEAWTSLLAPNVG